MLTRIHTYTLIQIHSKHIMNLGLPYFGAEVVGDYGDGAPSVGAPGVGILGAGAHVVGAHNFGAHGKTPLYCRHSTKSRLTWDLIYDFEGCPKTFVYSLYLA